MMHSQIADGGNSHEILRIAVNILHRQSQTTSKRWSSSLRGWWGANNSSP